MAKRRKSGRKVGFSGSLGAIVGTVGTAFKKPKGKTTAEKIAKKILKARKAYQKAKVLKTKHFEQKRKSIYD